MNATASPTKRDRLMAALQAQHAVICKELTMTKHDRMIFRIDRHGRQLLAMFPDAAQRDPQRLCRQLRRGEAVAHRLAEQWCNGEINEAQYDAGVKLVLGRVGELLGNSGRVWVNSDPRGYALKVDLLPGESLHRDMGGSGIIAPDLSAD